MPPRSDPNMLRRAVKSSIQQTYPLAIGDLTKEHMQLLIDVLNIDNVMTQERRTSFPQNPAWIQEGIKRLPWELRRHKFIRVVPNAFIYPAVLCESHFSLNPYVIGHILSLVKREVIEHLRHMERYKGEMVSDCRELLIELQGIRGLWNSDRKYKGYLELMSFTHQHNKCEACMLGQIIGSTPCLQNLRTTLLSRTRTRAKPHRPHRAPQLLRFIDGGIDTHEKLITDLYYQSGQQAYSFKEARKLATEQYKERRKSRDHEDDKSEDENGSVLNCKERETILVFWDQDTEQGSDTLSGPTAVETLSDNAASKPSSPKTAADYNDEFETIYQNREPKRTTASETLIEQIIAEYAGLTGTEDMDDARHSFYAMQPDMVPPAPLSVTKPAGGSPRNSRDPYAYSPVRAQYPVERCRSPLAFSGESPSAGSLTTKYHPTERCRSPLAFPRKTPSGDSPAAKYYATERSPLTPPGMSPFADPPTKNHYPTERRRPSLMGSASPKKPQFDYSVPRDSINWRKFIHKHSPLSILSANAKLAYDGLENDAEQIAIEYRELMSPVAYSNSVYSVSPDQSPTHSPAPSPRRLTTWDVLCKDLDIKYPVAVVKETRKKGLLRRFIK